MPRIDERENLNGFAEAHVIRQTGSETAFVHGEQPAEAFLLVGAERCAERWRRIGRNRRDVAKMTRIFAERFVEFDLLLFEQCFDKRRLF